jgi:uncharacterized protein DUF5317
MGTPGAETNPIRPLMALALPLVAGLLIAPLLGGRWSMLADVRLRLVTAFSVAIALQVVAFPASALPWHTSDRLGVILWLCSYAVFALAAGANLRAPGMVLVVVGMCSNLVAILTNGGHMPALPSALRAAGLHFETSRNSTVAASPHVATAGRSRPGFPSGTSSRSAMC